MSCTILPRLTMTCFVDPVKAHILKEIEVVVVIVFEIDTQLVARRSNTGTTEAVPTRDAKENPGLRVLLVRDVQGIEDLSTQLCFSGQNYFLESLVHSSGSSTKVRRKFCLLMNNSQFVLGWNDIRLFLTQIDSIS